MKTRLVSIIVVAFCFSFLAAGLTQAQQQVTITCDNDSAVVVPEKLEICPGDSVTFLAIIGEAGGCPNGANITGDAPIGSFSLTPSDSTETVTFANSGTYNYTVTKQTKGATQAKIVVLQSCNPLCSPTLTEWGIIVFSALFILALIFVLRRRAKAPIPA